MNQTQLKMLVLVSIVLTGATTLVREAHHYNSNSHTDATVKPPPQNEVNVITAVTHTASQSHVVPPVVPDNVGYSGIFESGSGLHYEFSQTGQRVDVHLLNSDGGRHYVGTAYDEGDRLRFESFYSPIYKKWGNFPSMRQHGDTLVSESRDGARSVYFKRVR